MPEGAGLPTGTVTFLFTDIEGSTRLLDRLGDRYPAVLEAHQRLLRDVFGDHGGVEVATEGDSFFVVFASAPRAVAAAVEAQRALAGHPWPNEGEVRVRMGLHTGEGILGADNYVGVDLHRAARIAATGHGGQVVVSDTTVALAQHVEGISFRDLGEHRLKDLPRPEHLYQVTAEGLDLEFPSLRSRDARPNNLPPQLTSFVGRRHEIDEVMELVRQGRLLTMTGPGGTGKTRLSIQVASEMLPEFEGGTFFVALAPIRDPALVMSTVAQALGLRESAQQMPLEAVIEHLRDKDLLLVMDNFEQVLPAAPEVGQLLTATERVRVLATSREPLGLHGEREYPVPPLGLPDPAHLPSLERLSQYEAVALFIERAGAVKPGFAVTNENAPAIAEICARLDGLPLAIELAAARTKLLSPEAMLSRLEHRLSLLTGGARDLPTRQQTLRDAIAWSFYLLEEEERTLFARLAVFVGGFTLNAVDEVCNARGKLGIDTLDGVASLVNKSLVRQAEAETGDPRFFMLETIREYAADRLAESETADEIRERHASYCLGLAEGAAPKLTGADQVHWLDLLSAEHDNFRAALAWLQGRGDSERAQLLGAALWRYWQMRGHLREGLERLQSILAMPGADGHLEARARALEAAGGVAYWMADPSARMFYDECLEIRRRLGEPGPLAEALYNRSFVDVFTLDQLNRRIDRAMVLLRESLDLFRQLGDEQGIAKALWGLGDMHYEVGEFDLAEPNLREALDMHRRLDDRFGIAWDLFLIGLNSRKQGRTEDARAAFVESLSILAEARDTSGVPLLLAGLAAVFATAGDAERGVRLAAAAAAIEARFGGGLSQVNEQFEEWESVRRSLALSDEEYDRLWKEGEAMDMDEAVADALSATQSTADPSS